ncbi:acetyltransferase [Virgibacillus profundi]|uniref:Acetyltransferase n=1 Tax=Virgibacillus profundi TaxID=2024555 RepID=A0A2A2IHS4_9BACI|nr:acetyltransferase [Virgibacillus profundi]PAV31551.1 acetyltransferase [Virgibacillus profundi]PXY55737.1 acetyltransferase [Virgibacillus profundi]
MSVVILGDGGHSRVIQEMIFCGGLYEVTAVLDDKYDHRFQEKGMIHAPISYLVKLFRHDTKVVVAIGSNEIRRKIVQSLNLLPKHYLTVVHPTAVVSRSAKIGNGTVIMPNAVINANANVGNHCIINTGGVVEHDNRVGDYSHISPNGTLAGNVTTGEGVHVGSSATVIPGKHLGSWSVIGAGSTVIEHIPAYSKAVGSPTRIIERILVKKE